jgi:hypothetical protein
MNRRDILKQIALITGSAVIGGELFLTGRKTSPKTDARFTTYNIALLDEVGETIIPATETPGAKAAKIGEFMKVMVIDCYTESQQKAFMQGIVDLDSSCEKMHGKPFMNCDVQQRKDFLISLEEEAKAFDRVKRIINKTTELIEGVNQGKDKPLELRESPSHYYTMMKQLTLLGFFTSETGMNETLRHIPIPGRYDGAVPYSNGEKAWAE